MRRVAELGPLDLIVRASTITHEFEQPIRRVCQTSSGGSYVAIFTLRLTPALDDATVRFTSEVTTPEAAPWIPHIEQGVRDFERQRAQENRPVGYFRVALVDIYVHEIDSKAWRFTEAASIAMSQAFAAHGVAADEHPSIQSR